MKKTGKLNFPEIRGFECFPEGKLLRQRVDFQGPVGIAYERCIGYTKPEHFHDRMTITFPRGSSRSFIKIFPEAETFNLNRHVVHLMAKDCLHEQGSISSVYDTLALFITESHFVAHLRMLGVKASRIEAFLRTTQSFPKGALLEELVDRYFFCRVLEESPSPVELNPLESLIMTEVFALADRARAATRSPKEARLDPEPPFMADETALVRAVEFIETHLFEKLEVPALVRASRTSQATLFRLFKRDLGVSPLEYVRNRRLDEARSLLESGQYQVGDVALLVGYEDLSTFSRAFKLRFRIAPSRALPDRGR